MDILYLTDRKQQNRIKIKFKRMKPKNSLIQISTFQGDFFDWTHQLTRLKEKKNCQIQEAQMKEMRSIRLPVDYVVVDWSPNLETGD